MVCALLLPDILKQAGVSSTPDRRNRTHIHNSEAHFLSHLQKGRKGKKKKTLKSDIQAGGQVG